MEPFQFHLLCISRHLIAVSVRRKPEEHASIDILRRQQKFHHGLYNQEAIIPFLPSLVSYQVLMDYLSLCMYSVG